MRKLPHRRIFKFIFILLGCVVLFQISALRSIQEKTYFPVSEEIRSIARVLTFSEVFDSAEESFRYRFGASWITDIFVPAIETIRFQGAFWIILISLPFLKINFFWSKVLVVTFFIFSAMLFIGNHGVVSHIVVGAVTLNILLWYYRSLFAPFAVHTAWNILQPILYPISLI